MNYPIFFAFELCGVILQYQQLFDLYLDTHAAFKMRGEKNCYAVKYTVSP